MSFVSPSQTLGDRIRECEVHVAAFLTTAATLSLRTNLKTIRGWSITAAGSPTVDEVFSLNETMQDYGAVAVSAGVVSIKRAATTTSGLIVSVILWGE